MGREGEHYARFILQDTVCLLVVSLSAFHSTLQCDVAVQLVALLAILGKSWLLAL
jgi:hypothetical protein